MFSLKQQKKETPSQSSAKPTPTKKSSSAQLRIAKDINELQIPKTCVLNFPDPDDLFNFKLVISPEEGYYKKGKFTFNFQISSSYPFEPPKVKCETKVYHPNIDLDGSICLNILRESWNPVLNLEVVIIGLQHLFLEPNPEDPLNKEAATILHTSPKMFAQHVDASITGGYIGNSYWDGIPGCNKKSYRY